MPNQSGLARLRVGPAGLRQASEIAHLRALYREVEASGDSSAPARAWAALGCFAVLTTVETLFY